MWLESWATALRASSWGWSLLAPCWQSQSSSVVAVLTQAGLCSPVQAGYKRLKAACVCALNSPTPRQGHRAPGKQHQSALLHREGSTLGEPWLSSMCQDSISTPTQVSCAPGALWPFQCLWWTGLSQDGYEGCLWAPAAIVQKDLLVCIPSSHAHYVSLWERSPGTGNPAKSLLCPLQDCPQVQWPTGSRSRDSAVHPHSLKATESPAPISASFRRKPSILCFLCWLKLQS